MRSATLLLAFGLVAASDAGAALASPPPVRLDSPPGGEALIGGEEARLAWSAAAEVEVEEWEAFLSLDGGRTWPVRLTPHLDARRRSFGVRIPALPSDDVRLLLRFGDERHETEFEPPQRFRIVAGRAPLADPLAPRSLPESARPGESEVFSWVEGDRQGGGRREVSAAASTGWSGREEPRLRVAGEPVDLLPPPSPPAPRSAPPASLPLAATRAPARLAANRSAVAPRAAPDTRLLIHRLNE